MGVFFPDGAILQLSFRKWQNCWSTFVRYQLPQPHFPSVLLLLGDHINRHFKAKSVRLFLSPVVFLHKTHFFIQDILSIFRKMGIHMCNIVNYFLFELSMNKTKQTYSWANHSRVQTDLLACEFKSIWCSFYHFNCWILFSCNGILISAVLWKQTSQRTHLLRWRFIMQTAASCLIITDDGQYFTVSARTWRRGREQLLLIHSLHLSAIQK